jgi:ACR3 family arsenite transporter
MKQQMGGQEGGIGFFERWLSLWVFSCIVVGVALGRLFPSSIHVLGALGVANVNIPVGLLIWVMTVPMLMKIDFHALYEVKRHWRGVAVTLFINWMVKPFSMAFFGWLFIRNLFTPWLPPGQTDGYIAGLILLAAAPCTAMVFVWSHLVKGDSLFTLTQVALNDIIMIFAFAPIVGGLLGISSIVTPWDTLTISVAGYIVLPLVMAQLWRANALRHQHGVAYLAKTIKTLHPYSIVALLATLALLFAFQGEALLKQPVVILLLAIPILAQVFLNAGLAYWLNRIFKSEHRVAGPSALIGASNFFELAVATAISLYGFESGAALATVVGVLVEVPVMLYIVNLVNTTKGWYEASVR